jgi:hypothetical protein
MGLADLFEVLVEMGTGHVEFAVVAERDDGRAGVALDVENLCGRAPPEADADVRDPPIEAVAHRPMTRRHGAWHRVVWEGGEVRPAEAVLTLPEAVELVVTRWGTGGAPFLFLAVRAGVAARPGGGGLGWPPPGGPVEVEVARAPRATLAVGISSAPIRRPGGTPPGRLGR